MAYDAAPSTWLSGWSEDATDITVPIATFPELTATEADGTTGDIRKVMYAICEKMYNEYIALDSADKPLKMVITKSSSLSASTGLATHSYYIRFTTEISSQEVADE